MSQSLLLLLQLLAILTTARFLGGCVRHVGQPAVVGEMLAGILLGPMVCGAVFPRFHAQLFDKASLGSLSSLSLLGLVLFMFVVGAELRAPAGVRAELRAAGAVGVLGVVLPMGLGLAISPWLHPRLAPPGVGFWPFALFMAAAMSITAFPVLARILKDRGMSQSPIGRLALGSAAIADALAWIVLAAVMALLGSGDGRLRLLETTVGLLVLCGLAFGAVRPILAAHLQRHAADGALSARFFAIVVIAMLASAALTEWLGLHAVFGAFVLGACLPRDDRLLRGLTERIEPLAVLVLMPVFFAMAGLQTTGHAFGGGRLGVLSLILLTATMGKIAGGALGARLAGYGWRDGLAIGSLMNARGLMELIVLKVGLDAGLIGPELFTLLLVMALVTTGMTGPLLTLFAGRDGGGSGSRRTVS